MPPHVAMWLTVAFISWLLVRDVKARPQLSHALWIPLLWLAILGSKPVYTWFGSQDTGGSQVDGNPIDRFAYLFLIIAGVVVIIRRRINWNELIADNNWLFIFFLYLGISALWSEYPFVAFKRWIEDLGNVTMVLVILSESDSVEAARAVFRRCAFILVPLSVLFIKYFPDLGRAYDQFSGAVAYCGVSDNKNTLGSTLIVYGIVLFWEVLELRDKPAQERKKFEMSSSVFMLAMIVWLFLKSNSQTSLVSTLLGVGVILAVRHPSFTIRLSRLEFNLCVTVVLFALLNSVGMIEAFVHALGRNMTFTGRTEIWQRALAVPINPLIGTGYYSFWLDNDRVAQVSRGFFFNLNEAHSGYVETYLNDGLVGICLLAAMLIFALRKIKRDLLNDLSRFNAFRLAFLAIAMVYNFTEAAYDRLDFIWVTLLLAVVGRVPLIQENSQEQGSEISENRLFAP